MKPTDTIGSCYNTSANAVRQYMKLEKRKSKPTISCLDEKGELIYPPKLPRLEPQKLKKTVAQKYRPGVIKLSVIINYTFLRVRTEFFFYTASVTKDHFQTIISSIFR